MKSETPEQRAERVAQRVVLDQLAERLADQFCVDPESVGIDPRRNTVEVSPAMLAELLDAARDRDLAIEQRDKIERTLEDVALKLAQHQKAATAYEISGVKVEARGGDSWAITRGGQCLSRSTGSWDFEPQPSSRTDAWKADHRYGLDEALAVALERS